MKLACSFNPAFESSVLKMYKNIQLMELGFLAYKKIFQVGSKPIYFCDNLSLSLHISRSPITEYVLHQNIFIKEKLAPIKEDVRIKSIGFHLCGDRCENIGKLGFSSHYNASEEKEENAVRFIYKVQEDTEKDVWIENANFYSSSPEEIYSNWKSFNRILTASKAKSIIDLSHLVIDCKNNGVDPTILIGLIDWEKVIEIHLSGIHLGKDGILHDGHDSSVSPMAWEILEKILHLNLLNDDVYINIEHSNTEWKYNQDSYDRDFLFLEERINNFKSISAKTLSPLRYAKNYLKKIIKNDIENFQEIVNHLDFTESELFDTWFHYIEKKGYRISLSEDEMDSMIASKSQYIIHSFTDFIEDIQYEDRN
ncbi:MULTISPECIES: DUF692 family multinuclear iron-containing protein [Xenorhabdus]|uniref:multinuclear nonheme iron-dependent oxidase n=1 Tax=Xenorhabdus TaxID=626 RepID=UPI000645DF7D|nr:MULTISPECIES: DUF692 family multinuclear iron-containing protein [Xenorhabdus]